MALLASSLGVRQRAALTSLLTRAFEGAAPEEALRAVGIACEGHPRGWVDALRSLARADAALDPLVAAALTRLPDDPTWLDLPGVATLRAATNGVAVARDVDDAGAVLAKVQRAGSAAWGTAWRVAPGKALTAAHCVGDLRRRALGAGALSLRFADGVREATVEDVAWDLDVALLRVEGEGAGAVPRLTGGAARGDVWQAKGYAKAHVVGMMAHGTVTDAGAVMPVEGATVPALQLHCEEGGHGALEGLSGAPVWGARGVIGLVRYGPPDLKQTVVMATRWEDIAARFRCWEVR